MDVLKMKEEEEGEISQQDIARSSGVQLPCAVFVIQRHVCVIGGNVI